ncbi:MAG: hypothetical protein NXI27_31780, partial [Alphaproteobacteria bacterium]|nr:hypothetical protein [Alphaproteobacteria bacterium]
AGGTAMRECRDRSTCNQHCRYDSRLFHVFDPSLGLLFERCEIRPTVAAVEDRWWGATRFVGSRRLA